VLADSPLGERDPDYLRSRAFEIAAAELSSSEDRRVVDWLEGVLKVIRSAGGEGQSPIHSEAHFTPGERAHQRIARLFSDARQSADVCVFTITDDRIADPMIQAHRRGIRIRIITDDDKVLDQGSDIVRLAEAGLAVRTDHSEHLMHHKFAVFDDRRLLTGSYNWTRSASADNQENFIITDDPRLVRQFSKTFQALWERFS
jgi:phosphatidylserine/phosphatidylglycerophosphate/cardiolipin synthase-like enzyme